MLTHPGGEGVQNNAYIVGNKTPRVKHSARSRAEIRQV